MQYTDSCSFALYLLCSSPTKARSLNSWGETKASICVACLMTCGGNLLPELLSFFNWRAVQPLSAHHKSTVSAFPVNIPARGALSKKNITLTTSSGAFWLCAFSSRQQVFAPPENKRYLALTRPLRGSSDTLNPVETAQKMKEAW